MSLRRLTYCLLVTMTLATLGAAITTFGFAGPVRAEDAADTKDASEDQAAKEPVWHEFHFPERGFVASFPDVTERPKPESTPVPGQNPLLQHEYKVKADNDTVYSIVVFEYPEGRAPNPSTQDYFEKIVAAYAKGSDTKVRSQTPIKINGRPGYEAKAEDDRGKLNHLITLVANGDRIYMLISAGPKKHASSVEALRFRDGFRLLGGPPPPDTADSSNANR